MAPALRMTVSNSSLSPTIYADFYSAQSKRSNHFFFRAVGGASGGGLFLGRPEGCTVRDWPPAFLTRLKKRLPSSIRPRRMR